jgi:predicted cupin superfamily sugar epimerase
MSYGEFAFGFYGHRDELDYDGFTTEEMIRALDLSPLPGEGGYFKQILKSEKKSDFLDEDSERYDGERAEYTVINYLMTPKNFSALHALKSNECWTFIAGNPVEICVINSGSGEESRIVLSKENRKFLVPRDQIFGARSLSADESSFSLVTCEVRPGFEFNDFILVNPGLILSRFSHLKETVKEFTRPEASREESLKADAPAI